MFYKDINGLWKFSKIPKHFNPIYAESLEKYFNCLDPLFEKAQKKSDFEFILSLLNISGYQDAGWIAFETTEDIFLFFNKLKNKIRYGNERLYIFLLLYGLIVEASYPYDLIANLLNVASGNRFLRNNFPDKKTSRNKSRPQLTGEKINKLIEMAYKINIEKAIEPIIEVFDRELRNAIFHSDYVIYGKEIRIPSSKKIFMRSEVIALINKAIA